MPHIGPTGWATSRVLSPVVGSCSSDDPEQEEAVLVLILKQEEAVLVLILSRMKLF